jgi:hypothetical protein
MFRVRTIITQQTSDPPSDNADISSAVRLRASAMLRIGGSPMRGTSTMQPSSTAKKSLPASHKNPTLNHSPTNEKTVNPAILHRAFQVNKSRPRFEA